MPLTGSQILEVRSEMQKVLLHDFAQYLTQYPLENQFNSYIQSEIKWFIQNRSAQQYNRAKIIGILRTRASTGFIPFAENALNISLAPLERQYHLHPERETTRMFEVGYTYKIWVAQETDRGLVEFARISDIHLESRSAENTYQFRTDGVEFEIKRNPKTNIYYLPRKSIEKLRLKGLSSSVNRTMIVARATIQNV